MKRTLLLVGLIALICGVLVPGADSDEPENGQWINPNSSPICLQPELSPDSICVDWYQPDSADHGTVCCVSASNRSRHTLDDCEFLIFSSRGARPDDMAS